MKIKIEPLSLRHVSQRYGQWFGDPEVCRDNRHGAKPLSVAQVRRYIQSLSKDSSIKAFAILAGPKRIHVGNVSLNGISKENGSAEISILIGEKDFWSKGVGYEACKLVKDVAFKKMKLNRIWMGMTTRNRAMIRVCEKLGMYRESIRPQAFVKNGEFLDLVEYACLRPGLSRKPVVLLMKYGNIVGLEYLRLFRREGLPVDAVIFQGDSFDSKDHQIVMERTLGRYTPLFAGEVLNGSTFPVYYVKKHDSEECEKILKQLNPAVIVLAGAGIIPERILKLATKGALNCHPGLLPQYRGCSCVEWAIYNNDPVAATCHTATAKIDWGALIYSEALPIRRGETYPEIRARMITHQAKVMAEGLRRFLKSKSAWPLMKEFGQYWKTMGSEELKQVKMKLEKGEYSPGAVPVCR